MTQLDHLEFTVVGYISRPAAEVYEAVADPARLSKYFTTGGASARLESGVVVSWDFHDFPGAFDVAVMEAVAPQRIVIRWAGNDSVDDGFTTTTFDFEPVDDDTRTCVRVTERSWQLTEEGSQFAFGNCMGWTGMLAAMKVWMEHGIVLREGFYR